MRTRHVDQAAAREQNEGRFGSLATPPWSDGHEVRCACDHCGAHLLAAPGLHGRLYGVCLVCGGDQFTRVS